MLSAFVALCFYISHAPETRAQQQRNSSQTTQASSAAAAGSAQKPAQATASSQPQEFRGRASESLIDDSIKDDPELKKVIAPYKSKVDELNTPVGKLADELKKEGVGGGSVGNFVVDAMRSVAEKRLGKSTALAVTNTSGIRKNWISPGELKASDIYEMMPFENALVALDLTGEQLLRFMAVSVSRRDAQSGARIIFHNDPEKKRNELVSIKLLEGGAERDIDPKATYTIITIDYLVKRGGDYSMLQEAKNIRPLNITMRDALLEYVKGETAAGRVIKANLDGRFKSDKPGAEDEQK